MKTDEYINCRGVIHHARPVLILALLLLISSWGCETRVIKKEERPFMIWAEQNWKRLTPRQKANYYEMLEKQKERARKEKQKGSPSDY